MAYKDGLQRVEVRDEALFALVERLQSLVFIFVLLDVIVVLEHEVLVASNDILLATVSLASHVGGSAPGAASLCNVKGYNIQMRSSSPMPRDVLCHQSSKTQRI